MSARLRLNKLLKRLVGAVRKIYGKKGYRLLFYKGVIRPDVIDTNAANVLGQALVSAPEQIHLVADIKLTTKNNLLPIKSPDSEIRSEIRDEIKPILSTIQDYLRYFLINKNYR